MDPPLSGAVNMARDHALTRERAEGTAVLRFYSWVEPTVSFGRNEPVPPGFPRDPRGRPGVGAVRRPSGGRAVLHHRELTYAVAVPAQGPGTPRALYRAVHRGLVEGLRWVGVPAEIPPGGKALPPDAGPCFRAPAPGEVTLGGRKLVGSAQVRLGRGILQHGSILLGPGQEMLAALLGEVEEPGEAASLGELSGGPPPVDRLVDGLIQGLRRELGGAWTDPVMDPGPAGGEEELVHLYGDPEWTWRR